MNVDKALAVVQSMASRRRPRYRRPSLALTYQPDIIRVGWTWDSATPKERANSVRAHRKMGIMDWDLCDLFSLTRDGLAEIVRGKDWEPWHHAVGQ